MINQISKADVVATEATRKLQEIRYTLGIDISDEWFDALHDSMLYDLALQHDAKASRPSEAETNTATI